MKTVKAAIAGILIVLCALPGHVSASVFSGEGALYYDRGHYWIELPLVISDDDSVTVEDFAPGRFVITDPDDIDSSFSPSRSELVRTDSGKRVVVLSSSRLKGRKCYLVVFRSAEGEETELGPLCDPFYDGTALERPGRDGFFKRYVASAFSTDGEYYRFNRLSYGYDLSAERTTTRIEIEPEFTSSRFSLSPFFDYDRYSYKKDSGSSRDAARRRAGIDLSASFWLGGIKYSPSLRYCHLREEGSDGAGTELAYSQSISASVGVRLDNLFDRVNIDGSSVFKGIDLIFGHAWFDSSGTDPWKTDEFRRDSPFLEGRGTWTVFGGLQISYSIVSHWPDSDADNAELMHRFRIRLLLRDLLERPAGRSYHPDLEFGIDRGRRFPFFGFEEKVFLGFTFDLYPW